MWTEGKKAIFMTNSPETSCLGNALSMVALWHLPPLPHLHVVLEITIAVFAAPLIGVAYAWSVECHSERTENIL